MFATSILAVLAHGTLSLAKDPAEFVSTTSACKAYPGDISWPSVATWNRLNASLGGHLISPVPPGAVCHPEQTAYNVSECHIIQTAWETYDLHVNDPVSVMWDQFSNYSCLPDAQGPCSNRGYPSYVVNASTTQDVKKGVDFARNKNMRLIVKSTGHDYIGRSIAPNDALSIWVHRLNNMTYHANGFDLHGSGKYVSGKFVTVGGGSQMYDIISALAKHNRTVVSGSCKTVSIGGYVTGGGHSLLSPRYGLAADNVIEIEVVTPLGAILIVNEDFGRDLFWALRGGGGSSFGIITAVTMKTHPTPKILSIDFEVLTEANSSIFYDLSSFVLQRVPDLMDSGLSGYGQIKQHIPNPVPSPGSPSMFSGVLASTILLDPEGPDAAAQFIKPLNDSFNEKWPGKVRFVPRVTSYDTFLDWYDAHYYKESTGSGLYLVSRLLDRDTLVSDTPERKQALTTAISALGDLEFFMVGGKGVIEAKPAGGGSAINPAWRSAYVHSLSGVVFNETGQQKAIKMTETAFQLLRDLTPKSGAYINEASPFEKNFQDVFWGSNYDRLLSVKRMVDPTGVLWCSPCVGSEHWMQRNDGRLCRV